MPIFEVLPRCPQCGDPVEWYNAIVVQWTRVYHIRCYDILHRIGPYKTPKRIKP